jgi:hypothetical protein
VTRIAAALDTGLIELVHAMESLPKR